MVLNYQLQKNITQIEYLSVSGITDYIFRLIYKDILLLSLN